MIVEPEIFRIFLDKISNHSEMVIFRFGEMVRMHREVYTLAHNTFYIYVMSILSNVDFIKSISIL